MTLNTRLSWDWRPKLRWFAAEFLVVVTGVLVALALNALYERRQDVRSEQVYLSLLVRDIDKTIANLDSEAEFEALQLRDGVVAYRAISRDEPADFAAASAALQHLTVRRTLVLHDATYQDLISTGNLRLIRNRELRDRIVDFFESTQSRFEILNKNNSFFVDELYNGIVLSQGLIVPRTALGNNASLAATDSALLSSLGPGYVSEPDRLWSLPRDAPEWAQVKSVLLTRIRVAAIAQRFTADMQAETRALKAAVAAELVQL